MSDDGGPYYGEVVVLIASGVLVEIRTGLYLVLRTKGILQEGTEVTANEVIEAMSNN